MPDTMTSEDFVKAWENSNLAERQTYQLHFLDVCKLVGHAPPNASGVNEHDKPYLFERSLKKDTGGQGFADVFYWGHFAIEYKAPGKYKNLDDALDQLLLYRINLDNPPVLVVTDINNWEIHTNFQNTEKRVYKFSHEDIATSKTAQRLLRDMFFAPERLHPDRNTEQVTREAAEVFRTIADNMRNWEAQPERIAHFLTKLVFCLFAEDVSLLPTAPNTETGIFSHTIQQTRTNTKLFVKYMHDLFEAMADGGDFLMKEIPYFNGSLFDDVDVEELSLEALTALENAAKLNWESIEPSIFGTLFERSLDPNKRAQLGAHYTSRDDIMLIVEPVLMQPLRREWDTIQLKAQPIREKLDNASSKRAETTARNDLEKLREEILHQVRSITVLDPACGSGNFLYVSLQLLMDLEKEIITHPLWAGLPRPFPEVHPRQMYGIEVNPIAHALASIVVWIGYIQWRNNNGYGQAFKVPILEALQDNIVCKDAILPPINNPRRGGSLVPPLSATDQSPATNDPTNTVGTGLALSATVEWQPVDVIVGNPPFLGGSKIRGELGDEYYERLTKFYAGRLPGFADLVCYWYEKAREHIETGKAKRAGLLATNSIRGGANREVLKHIKETGDIFMAWADREWVLDGAAVRVSMVGFDDATQKEKTLDGLPVANINPDLSATVDITKAKILEDNENISFQGPSPKGSFDIDYNLAMKMIKNVNSTGINNSDVVKPVINASDIVRNSRNYWTIDFGPYMSEEEAKQYEEPYNYVLENVYPIRKTNNRKAYRDKWWIYAEARVAMREQLANLSQYIGTPRVAKHRVFVWVDGNVISNDALIVFARDDDYFFGVLHSRLHEVWSLRMGTWLGKGNDPRYTPTTTFETFPFPWSPDDEDETHPAYQAIAQSAKQLHEERTAWLNPNNTENTVGTGLALSAKSLKDRTLTNLYNALQVYRGLDTISIKASAGDFAPRLDVLHEALDKAVCDAYGWEHDILDDEEEILRRLLALNLQRAGEG